MIKKTMCRVCGYDYKDYYPWGEDENSPTHDICDCCGIEFGYEDDNAKGIKIAREKWIKEGMLWHRARQSVLYQAAPADYNPVEQLKRIQE